MYGILRSIIPRYYLNIFGIGEKKNLYPASERNEDKIIINEILDGAHITMFLNHLNN